MIREDPELLAELARLNRDMVPLVVTIMEDSASAAEQEHYAGRLIAAGKRLQRRADQMAGTVVEATVMFQRKHRVNKRGQCRSIRASDQPCA